MAAPQSSKRRVRSSRTARHNRPIIYCDIRGGFQGIAEVSCWNFSGMRRALTSGGGGVGSEPVHQLIRTHVSKLFANTTLQVAVIRRESLELELQRSVRVEQLPIRGFELSSTRTQHHQVAQAERTDSEIERERQGDGSQNDGQPLTAEIEREAAHKASS